MTTGSSNEKRGRGRPKKWKPREPIAPTTELPKDSAIETAEDGGLDEALKGAGLEGEASPTEGESTKPSTSPEPPKTPPAGSVPQPVDPAEVEALINFCDMTTVIVCRGFAISRQVEWTNDIQKQCMLNPGEKKQLALVAPAAIPYVRQLMLHMDKVAAGLFFLSYAFMLAGRIGVIKAASKPKGEAGQTEKKPDVAGNGEPRAFPDASEGFGPRVQL